MINFSGHVDELNKCTGCLLAKSKRLPYKTSAEKVEAPFDKICCDVWGPAPLVSLDGFKYYVVFVDANAKFTWTYPMRLKSDFYDVFVSFEAMISRQFSKKIK